MSRFRDNMRRVSVSKDNEHSFVITASLHPPTNYSSTMISSKKFSPSRSVVSDTCNNNVTPNELREHNKEIYKNKSRLNSDIPKYKFSTTMPVSKTAQKSSKDSKKSPIISVGIKQKAQARLMAFQQRLNNKGRTAPTDTDVNVNHQNKTDDDFSNCKQYGGRLTSSHLSSNRAAKRCMPFDRSLDEADRSPSRPTTNTVSPVLKPGPERREKCLRSEDDSLPEKSFQPSVESVKYNKKQSESVDSQPHTKVSRAQQRLLNIQRNSHTQRQGPGTPSSRDRTDVAVDGSHSGSSPSLASKGSDNQQQSQKSAPRKFFRIAAYRPSDPVRDGSNKRPAEKLESSVEAPASPPVKRSRIMTTIAAPRSKSMKSGTSGSKSSSLEGSVNFVTATTRNIIQSVIIPTQAQPAWPTAVQPETPPVHVDQQLTMYAKAQDSKQEDPDQLLQSRLSDKSAAIQHTVNSWVAESEAENIEYDMEWEPSPIEMELIKHDAKDVRKNLIKIEPTEEDIVYHIVVDTNMFLTHLKFIDYLLDSHTKVLGRPILIVSWVVLQELDGLKMGKFEKGKETNTFTKLQTIKAIRWIHNGLKFNSQRVKGDEKMANNSVDQFTKNLAMSGDDNLMATCLFLKQQKKTVLFLSEDVNLRSKAFGVNVIARSKEELENEMQNGLVEKLSLFPVITPNPYQKRQIVFHSVKESLSSALGKVFVTEMKRAYGERWTAMVKRKYPWSTYDIVSNFLSHWGGVFAFAFSSDTQMHFKDIQDFLRLWRPKKENPTFKQLYDFTGLCLTLFSILPVKENADALRVCTVEFQKIQQACHLAICPAPQQKALSPIPSDPTTSCSAFGTQHPPTQPEVCSSPQPVVHTSPQAEPQLESLQARPELQPQASVGRLTSQTGSPLELPLPQSSSEVVQNAYDPWDQDEEAMDYCEDVNYPSREQEACEDVIRFLGKIHQKLIGICVFGCHVRKVQHPVCTGIEVPYVFSPPDAKTLLMTINSSGEKNHTLISNLEMVLNEPPFILTSESTLVNTLCTAIVAFSNDYVEDFVIPQSVATLCQNEMGRLEISKSLLQYKAVRDCMNMLKQDLLAEINSS